MTSYLTSIDTFSLSRTAYEIFDFIYGDGNPTPIPRQRVYRDSPEQYFNIILAVKKYCLVSWEKGSSICCPSLPSPQIKLGGPSQ